jgi:hypothetical protein
MPTYARHAINPSEPEQAPEPSPLKPQLPYECTALAVQTAVISWFKAHKSEWGIEINGLEVYWADTCGTKGTDRPINYSNQRFPLMVGAGPGGNEGWLVEISVAVTGQERPERLVLAKVWSAKAAGEISGLLLSTFADAFGY